MNTDTKLAIMVFIITALLLAVPVGFLYRLIVG